MKGVKMTMPIVEIPLSPHPSLCQGEGAAKDWFPMKNLPLYASCVGEDTGTLPHRGGVV
jgi:hypothetical protein